MRLHTGLCKFAQSISTSIWRLGKRRDLKLGEVSSLPIYYNITISWLYPLNSFRFIFSLCDSENDLKSGMWRFNNFASQKHSRLLAPVFQRLDSTIQRISIGQTNYAIRKIVLSTLWTTGAWSPSRFAAKYHVTCSYVLKRSVVMCFLGNRRCIFTPQRSEMWFVDSVPI